MGLYLYIYIYRKGFTLPGHAVPWFWGGAQAQPCQGRAAQCGQMDRQTDRRTGCCWIHLPQALQLSYGEEDADMRNAF